MSILHADLQERAQFRWVKQREKEGEIPECPDGRPQTETAA